MSVTTTHTHQHSSTLTPAQRDHNALFRNIGPIVEWKKQHLAAHTVLPSALSQNFSGPIVDLKDGVDAVAVKFWKRRRFGERPASATRFALYHATYHRPTNTVTYAKAETNIFCKDASLFPRPGAPASKTIDPEKSPANFNAALDLEAAIEAAARNPELLVGRPRLSRCLLGFLEHDTPSIVINDENRAVLQEAALDMIWEDEPSKDPPTLLTSDVAGKITMIESDDTGHAIVVATGNEQVVIELPPWVIINNALVKQGDHLLTGIRLGHFSDAAKCNCWEDLADQTSEKHQKWLLEGTWEHHYVACRMPGFATDSRQRSVEEEIRYCCIPHNFLTLDQAKRSVRQFRDVGHLLGRRLLNPANPNIELGFESSQAGISVWSTDGDAARLTISGPKFVADFNGVNGMYAAYFSPDEAPMPPEDPERQVSRYNVRR